MLKVHRNSIYICLPIFVLSFLLAIFFNFLFALTSGTNIWFSFLCNMFLGIMGSSLLSLILAFIGYYRERRIVLESYYFQIIKMLNLSIKYKKCNIENKEKLEENIIILKQLIYDEVRELGNIYGQISLIFDKKHNKRNYLYGYYKYFENIKNLVYNNVRILEAGVKDKALLDYIDNVMLDIVEDEYNGCSYIHINNRVARDINEEINDLLKLVNHNDRMKDKFYFNKTVITEKIFSLENEHIEKQLKILNDKVNFANSRSVSGEEIENLDIEYLFNNQYITAIRKDSNEKLTAITVGDKSYYYFDYKEQYEKQRS